MKNHNFWHGKLWCNAAMEKLRVLITEASPTLHFQLTLYATHLSVTSHLTQAIINKHSPCSVRAVSPLSDRGWPDDWYSYYCGYNPKRPSLENETEIENEWTITSCPIIHLLTTLNSRLLREYKEENAQLIPHLIFNFLCSLPCFLAHMKLGSQWCRNVNLDLSCASLY